MHPIAIRSTPSGFTVGEAHARVRRGRQEVELKKPRYVRDPDDALELAREALLIGTMPDAPKPSAARVARLTGQTKTVLEHLQRHGSITKREAMEQHRIYNLPGRIFELREIFGADAIETESEKHKGGSHGRYKWTGKAEAQLTLDGVS